MKWKKIVIWGFFLFLLLIFGSPQAQATTNKTQCRWNKDTKQCYQWEDCDPGCVPPVLNCHQMSEHVCKLGPAPHDCNCAGPGTLKCEWKETFGGGGFCRRIGDCGSGYEPSPPTDPCRSYQKNDCPGADAGTCIQSKIPQPTPPVKFEPCKNVQGEEKAKCENCFKSIDEGGEGGTWTALGCIPTENTQDFIAWLLAWAIGIAGGIAFLLMIFAGFQIITSAGDPKKLQAGKELLTSAIVGLIVIIFSLFLLQLIGVQILKIPGFGE